MCAHAHRELVAEAARNRDAHAGNLQVFAQHRGRFDVEVVECDDSIEAFGAGQVCGARSDVVLRHAAADVVELVDRVSRPVAVAELLLGQEQHPRALAPAFLQELVALAVRRDAEDREHASWS
jgi:hypothetical protein